MDAEHKALVIIDMLNDYVLEGSPVEVPNAGGIIANISGEIRYARDRNRPIIYVCDSHQDQDPEFESWPKHAVKHTPGARIVEPLEPLPGDHLIEKVGYSGFFRTDLELLLDRLDIDEILLCGVLTNVGILYTAVDAMQRGLRVIVPETCVAALDAYSHAFALKQIKSLPHLFAG